MIILNWVYDNNSGERNELFFTLWEVCTTSVDDKIQNTCDKSSFSLNNSRTKY